jgi:hypothetical protein
MPKVISLLASAVLLSGLAIGQTSSPGASAAITRTALDYVEGWHG